MDYGGAPVYLQADLPQSGRDFRFIDKAELPFRVTDGQLWLSHPPVGGTIRRDQGDSFTACAPPGSLLERIHLVGAFGLYADEEAKGTIGASIHLYLGEKKVHQIDLVQGSHYAVTSDREFRAESLGDGVEVQPVGLLESNGAKHRCDWVAIDVPATSNVDRVVFTDSGSPAVFALTQAFLQARATVRCPFHSMGGGIPLHEVAAIVRVRDHVRFEKALEQFERSLSITTDLDEARGEALTFLAVVTAGLLETGGPRTIHRIQLEAAREFDRCTSVESVLIACKGILYELAGDLLSHSTDGSARIIDRALAHIDRNFAAELSDDTLAAQVGLSTSHFRFLFKQSTGQPFHKYLMSVRLEKARALLSGGTLSVSEVAHSVGFHGLSHFSRAFAQRFGVSPNDYRRSTRA